MNNNDRGEHVSPHTVVSWTVEPATKVVEHDTPGARMRAAKVTTTPSADADKVLARSIEKDALIGEMTTVIRRLRAQRQALADSIVADRQANKSVTPRSGLTPTGSPYEIASALRGLTERRPDGTLNPLIEQFHGATFFTEGDGDDAWCASFMNWCLREAGMDELMTDSPRARSFAKLPWFIEGTQGLVEGDIVVFTRGKNPAKGHVAFSTVSGVLPPYYII